MRFLLSFLPNDIPQHHRRIELKFQRMHMSVRSTSDTWLLGLGSALQICLVPSSCHPTKRGSADSKLILTAFLDGFLAPRMEDRRLFRDVGRVLLQAGRLSPSLSPVLNGPTKGSTLWLLVWSGERMLWVVTWCFLIRLTSYEERVCSECCSFEWRVLEGCD